MQYKVVRCNHVNDSSCLKKFEEEVTSLLKAGWKLGNFCATSVGRSSNREAEIFQTLYKGDV